MTDSLVTNGYCGLDYNGSLGGLADCIGIPTTSPYMSSEYSL